MCKCGDGYLCLNLSAAQEIAAKLKDYEDFLDGALDTKGALLRTLKQIDENFGLEDIEVLPDKFTQLRDKLKLHEDHELRREEPESVGLQQLGVHRLVCVTCERAEKRAEALEEIKALPINQSLTRRIEVEAHDLADAALCEEGK